MSDSDTRAPKVRERLLLAGLPLATGGAVLVAIILSIGSLLLPTALLMAGTGLVAVVVARRIGAAARAVLAVRIRVGLVAGVAATVAYDTARYGVVALADWSLDPFSTFGLFGRMIVGTHTGTVVRYVVGTGFHLLNGLGFAVGYLIVFARPRVWTAICWALVLEAITITFYPSWLGLTAVGEFFSMSLIGHLAYGAVLGETAHRLLRRTGSPS